MLATLGSGIADAPPVYFNSSSFWPPAPVPAEVSRDQAPLKEFANPVVSIENLLVLNP
jgi:hypothetical protein